jgi:GMP synthase-like glutamine amidotransferase
VPRRVAFLQHSASDVPGLLERFADGLGLDVSVHRADHGPDALPATGSFDLLVVMGSIESVYDTSVPWISPERAVVSTAVDKGVPVLGICFGAQLLAEVLGGSVTLAPRPELGWGTIRTDEPGWIGPGPWLNWHDDAILCPPGAVALARTDAALQAFAQGRHTGIQFHPEVTVDVVHGWIEDARDQAGIADDDARDLLSGFDDRGRGPEQQTRTLFEGFLVRADRQS